MNTVLFPLFIVATTLTGNVSHNEITTSVNQDNLKQPISQNNANLLEEQPRIQIRLPQRKHELSAIGIRSVTGSGLITYVDPASSVYGQIYPGDYILTIDGISVNRAHQERRNYGVEMSKVLVVFRTKAGEEIPLLVQRQPVTNFSSYCRAGLLPY